MNIIKQNEIVAIHSVGSIVLKATHCAEFPNEIKVSYNGGAPFTILDFNEEVNERNVANSFVQWCESESGKNTIRSAIYYDVH